MVGWNDGQSIHSIGMAGTAARAASCNAHQVRAAAGQTLALGAVAFVYAYFAKLYTPLQVITALFFVDFGMRVMFGVHRSPIGVIAGWMVRHLPPHWVAAKPKRFAWSLGLALSLVMTIATNSGIRGALPLSICLVCLTLMWLETALGLCLGCWIYGLLLRRGWVRSSDASESCASGSCAVEPMPTPLSGTEPRR